MRWSIRTSELIIKMERRNSFNCLLKHTTIHSLNTDSLFDDKEKRFSYFIPSSLLYGCASVPCRNKQNDIFHIQNERDASELSDSTLEQISIL
jgi:hypothetical protein